MDGGSWQGVPGQQQLGQYAASYTTAPYQPQQDAYNGPVYATGMYGQPAQPSPAVYSTGYAPQPAAGYVAPQTGSYSSQFSQYSEPVNVAYPTLPSYPEPPRYSEPQRASRPTQQSQSYASSASQFAPEEPGGPEGSSRFKVIILPSEDGGDILDVICQVGLDGIKLLDANRKTTLRIYPLEHVTRWTVNDPTILTFFVKTSVDSDERSIHLTSDERTTRSILDVLTCSCLQLCELRGIDPGDMSGKSATNKLAGTGPVAAAPIPASAEGIEFWSGQEHSGWLTKKGEHLSTWRRRWFILKEGHLFWFYNNNVSSSSKPRGIIPLKTCASVRSASVSEAGKPYALELDSPEANSAGARHLVADSESDKNAWVAAVQKALDSIKAASEPPPARSHEQLAEQLKKGFESLSATGVGVTAGRTVEVSSYGGGGRRQDTYDGGGYYQPQSTSSSGGYGGTNGGGDGGGYGGSYGQQQQPQQQQRWQEPQQQSASWQVHYTNEGRAYYFNPQTNKTQWEPPVGFS